MTTTIKTVATKCLETMTNDILNQKVNKTSLTLAFWRVEHPKIREALEAFASKPDWTKKDDESFLKEPLEEVQTLFQEINRYMTEQERQVWPNAFTTAAAATSTTSAKENEEDVVSVVFGGKYSSQPKSISERLVSDLVDTSYHVFTVSRTQMTSLPSNVTHMTQQRLDDASVDVGAKEFQTVLQSAIEKTQTTQTQKRLVLYFTLGQHKGVNPFARNVYAANNFATAVERTFLDSSSLKELSLQVVVTGTDATLPSTTEYTNRTTIIDDLSINIPSYKISEYNFVYAMSKLYQFYRIAKSIMELREKGTKAIEGVSTIIDKLQSHVLAVGEDGNFQKNDKRQGVTIHTIPELDGISTNWLSVLEPSLSTTASSDTNNNIPRLVVARDISICYTPLHAVPWTQQSFVKCDKESDGSPKAYLIQQIVRRFKNAISINMAAKSHFM